jgi:hypothetical protein
MNKPYSKEDYYKKLEELNFGSRSMLGKIQKMFSDMCRKATVKYYVGTNNENSTGDYINNTKNCFTCFEIDNAEDVAYSMNLDDVKSSMDYSYWGANAERMYECQACGYELFNLKFCGLCWEDCSDLQYCDQCFASKNCFGCVGLKKAKYCILNQQYTQEEYEDFVPRIIAHMGKTGEYGEFFPTSHSTFAYNESLAYEHLPLSKEEVLQRGWQWIERSQEYKYQGPKVIVLDSIQEVSNEITKQILTCENCNRNYKIIAQEFKFYQEQGLPVPVLCSDCRHRARIALKNPRKLWNRNCMKCGTAIQTSYAPERKEIVYCEKCYQEAVY